MALSALFEIDPGTASYGAAGVAQDVDPAGATVNCRVADASDVVSVTWTIFGTHGASTPSITGSTSTQMSFAVPAGTSQAYGIQCTVRDSAGNTDTRTSAVYVLGYGYTRPFFTGERFERDSSFATVPDINRKFAGHFGEDYVSGGKDVLAGGAGATTLDSFTHSATGDAVLAVEAKAHAVDTGTPDTALYRAYYTFRVTAGGNPASGAVNLVAVESDATWALTVVASGAAILLQFTPDATNDTTIKWSWSVSVLEAEAA